MSPFRIGCVLALSTCITGCATRVPTTTSELVPSRRAGLVAPELVADAVVIGESSRTDVIAALGQTLVLGFDSGYEVWVYRLAGETSRRDAREPEETAEFVILFSPSGIVKKTRIRRVL